MMILWQVFRQSRKIFYEAASIDGAGALKKKSFLYITIPGIKNVLIFVVMMTTIRCHEAVYTALHHD